MKLSIKDRFAFWLERFTFLDRVLLRYDGAMPNGGKRYVNKINGHLVARTTDKEH